MPIDSALILRAASDLTTTETTTAINVEGGSMADVVCQWTAATGTSPTADVDFQVRIDGSNYVTLFSFRQFIGTDDAASPRSRIVFRRPVWIPQSTVADTWAGALNRVQCRLVITVGGSASPTFAGFEAFIDQFKGAKNRGYEQV